MINDLIKLASVLDESGLEREANRVDALIRKYSKSQVPDEDTALIRRERLNFDSESCKNLLLGYNPTTMISDDKPSQFSSIPHGEYEIYWGKIGDEAATIYCKFISENEEAGIMQSDDVLKKRISLALNNIIKNPSCSGESIRGGKKRDSYNNESHWAEDVLTKILSLNPNSCIPNT